MSFMRGETKGHGWKSYTTYYVCCFNGLAGMEHTDNQPITTGSPETRDYTLI